MIWGVMRYEWKMQLRSLVFWLGLILVGMMLFGELYQEGAEKLASAQRWASGTDPLFLRSYTPPSMIEHFQSLLANGFPPGDQASKMADRMQIVFTFVSLFTVGFVLDRDRLSKGQDVLLSRPVPPWAYIGGKYLGAVLPLLAASCVAAIGAYLLNLQLNQELGLSSRMLPFLKAWIIIVVPTILYVTALALAISLLLGRGAAVVPIHLAYMAVGGLVPFGGTGFRFDLTTFMVRTDGRQQSIWTDDWSMLLMNRGLYLVLTLLLLYLATRLYERRRVREVVP